MSHAEAVAALLAGYHARRMSDRDDRVITRAMKVRQDERAREERRDVARSADPDEAHAHRRRAEKAAYLRDKLAEAEASERAED